MGCHLIKTFMTQVREHQFL